MTRNMHLIWISAYRVVCTVP